MAGDMGLATRYRAAASAVVKNAPTGSVQLTSRGSIPSLRVAFAGRCGVNERRNGPQTPLIRHFCIEPDRHRLHLVVFFSESWTY